MPYLAALEEEIYRGREEIETMWREVLTDVPDFRIKLVEADFLGMARASGADIRTTVYQAVSFRHGKVASVKGFRTASEALEAVGLRD